MLQYLTPTTLKEMYKDLDEARLDLLNGVNEHNMIERSAEYSKLTDLINKIDVQYEALLGEPLIERSAEYSKLWASIEV